jgi:hypothetical protein
MFNDTLARPKQGQGMYTRILGSFSIFGAGQQGRASGRSCKIN